MKTALSAPNNAQPEILFWINHRLRQPLCTATGLAQLLILDDTLPDHLKPIVKELLVQCEKMDALSRTAVTEIMLQISDKHTIGR